MANTQKPKAGSFWFDTLGSPVYTYVEDPDKPTQCVGYVKRLRPGQYRAEKFDKPIPFATTLKESPQGNIRMLRSVAAGRMWLQRSEG